MSILSELLTSASQPPRAGSLSDIFAEEPVPLEVFVQDRKFMHNPALSPIQYDAVRHTEQVYLPEIYPVMQTEFGEYWKPVRHVNFLNLMYGKGSGKDHLCRVASLRIAYLLLCLKSPQDYFGMPSQDIIHMLNVASNRSQAFQAFFKPMTRLVGQGWFSDKCQVRQDIIEWDKNVEMISGHADAESQEGLNLILGIADEIDAFKTREELLQYRPNQTREPTKSAEAILKMLRTSASTRFPDSFKVMAISYPRYLGSTIMKLVADGKRDMELNGESSKDYASGPYATWEVNPRVKSKDQFSKDYKDDPVMAQTMYECKPVRAVDPYFRNTEAVRSVFRTDSPVEVSYRLEDSTVSLSDNISQVWVPEYEFAPEFVPMQGAQYAIHADLAIRGDRAGVAMSHVKSWTEVETASLDGEGAIQVSVESRPEVYVDFVIGYQADLRAIPAREIQIRWVRALVAELRSKGFVIGQVSYDSFQSFDSMQILESVGIRTQKISVDRDETAWRTLRDVMYEGRISLPVNELLLDELLQLRKLPNGKVDHPALGSKDLADAVAGSVQGALSLGGSETGERSYGNTGEFSTGSPIAFPIGLSQHVGLEPPIMHQ